ncbi:vacuolar protein 8-like [Canna indica]|uniref:Vacuolar protein 8-like n=1 Tax=Canna indica TaxID=4628 RepID=A0AAQ3KGI7_9LILI|nr:vacuolar protein 8-like [Canna indica]
MKVEMGQEEEEIDAVNPLQPQGIGLPEASELINLLISSSFSIRSFPAKWQLIRDKLERIHSALAAAACGRDSATSLELVGLLQDIRSTVSETQVLANRCSDESYSGGKLLLRSDLDVIAAKLDLHMRRLEEIYASGILTLSQAIVASRPGAGASREDMRFYVMDLISRLKIGDSEMRLGALDALNEVLCEDDKYVRILVLEVAEGVAFLVSLLESCSEGVREKVAESISVIACFDLHKGALVMAGAIALLIQLLETGSDLAKERAARALKKLTENSDNAWSVSAHGGVSALLQICGDDASSGDLIRSASGVLKSLSGVEEIKRFMVEQGAVSIFLKLSTSREESLQVQAIEFLSILACEDDFIKQKVIKEGLLTSLVQVLDPASPYSSKAKEVALGAIENFCFSSPSSVNYLMSSGFLDRVLFLLRSGEISIQESALKAVSRLSALSEVTKKAMGDAGFIPELVSLLEARSFHLREMAAEALAGMISIQRNRRRFIQEGENVNRILQLLNPEEKSVTKKFLLSALMSLTGSTSVRRKIVASGSVKHLEKLAEADATDAKKIIKKLSTNRFRSILTGIWSS